MHLFANLNMFDININITQQKRFFFQFLLKFSFYCLIILSRLSINIIYKSHFPVMKENPHFETQNSVWHHYKNLFKKQFSYIFCTTLFYSMRSSFFHQCWPDQQKVGVGLKWQTFDWVQQWMEKYIYWWLIVILCKAGIRWCPH